MDTTNSSDEYRCFEAVHAVSLAVSGIPSHLHKQLGDKIMSEIFDGGSFFRIEPCEGGRQRRLVFIDEFMKSESNIFLVDHSWTFRLQDAQKQVFRISCCWSDDFASDMSVFSSTTYEHKNRLRPLKKIMAVELMTGDCLRRSVRERWAVFPSMKEYNLQEKPGLAQRMASIMCVDDDSVSDFKKEGYNSDCSDSVLDTKLLEGGHGGICDNTLRWLELEEYNIDDKMLQSLDLCSKFPNLVAISLCGNKIESGEIFFHEIVKFKHLRAIWFNNNPFFKRSDVQLEDRILEACPTLEIYNSHFTRNHGAWALGFCGGLYGMDNPYCEAGEIHPLHKLTSLDLSNMHIHNLINKVFSSDRMPDLLYLNLRGNPLNCNSASELLKLLKNFTSLCELEVDVPGPLGDRPSDILKCLPNITTLNGIVASKFFESGTCSIDSILQPRFPKWDYGDPLFDRVRNAMWLFLMSYRLYDEQRMDETSIWYVMDELGSSLRHGDNPNFRISPFLYMPEGKLESSVSYSVLWPIRDVCMGDECTRDFLFGVDEEKQRSARLTAWFHTSEAYFVQELENRDCQLGSNPPLPICAVPRLTAIMNNGRAFRVYTDIPQVEQYLTRPEFQITTDPEDADIMWTSVQRDDDITEKTRFHLPQYTNQFPYETCLVMKHNLAETVKQVYGSTAWFQPTYNLETQLAQMIGDYIVRKRKESDNLWILKPWNMARTIDTMVTGDLSAIIRVMETGPKICQKYIENPALYKGRKFDLRYIVAVRSIRPLDIFCFDIFWVRLSNNLYTLDKDSLFEYETHFTVMNYGRRLNHIDCAVFVSEMEEEHKIKWSDIDGRIKEMLRSVFLAASVACPEMQSDFSRAIYGVDVMLDSSFNPKLLEVTYCPDCDRACKYDSKDVLNAGEVVYGIHFFNYVFGCLFLNETNHFTSL